MAVAIDNLLSSLPAHYSFSRTGTGSIADYYNSAGKIGFAAANVPTFTHDIVTLDPLVTLPLGLQMRDVVTNLIAHSEAMQTGNGWSHNITTVTANAIAAPDIAGNVTAELYTASSSSTYCYTYRAPTLTINTTYTASCFFKKGTADFVWLLGEGTGNCFGFFNLTTGAVAGMNGTGGVSQRIKALPGGWYYCEFTFTKATATAGEQVGFGIADAFNTSYSVTSGKSAYAWGYQLRQGSPALGYVPVGASSLTRGLDVCTVTTPPVDTSQPFAVMVNYSLLSGASAGGPLLYDSAEGNAVYSYADETCKVIRFDGVDTFTYTEDGAVTGSGFYAPGAMNIYLGNDGSLAINGCIEEVQWLPGDITDALMLSSAAARSFPTGINRFYRPPYRAPFRPPYSNVY